MGRRYSTPASRRTERETLARRYADAVIEDFYERLRSFEEMSSFFRDPKVLQRVKDAQQDYFLRLTQGDYDLAYAQNRLRIETIHERFGLPVKAILECTTNICVPWRAA